MTYLDASPSNLSKVQVNSIAESFAAQLDCKPGANLYDVVQRIGGKVAIEDTLLSDPERSGSLYVDAPDNFRIILPAHTGRARDRFTIAHELGHDVLHYLWNPDKRGKPMVALRRGSDRIEWEANWFAAAFLMPSEAFKRAYESTRDVAKVAEQFGVSLQAAELRAKNLHLI